METSYRLVVGRHRVASMTWLVQSLFAGVVFLTGLGAIVIGDHLGVLLFSPLAPSPGVIAIVRIVGIAVASIGVVCWPTGRRHRAVRSLALYSGITVAYLLALALVSCLDGVWPEPWVTSWATFHVVLFVGVGLSYLRLPKRRRRY